MFTREWFAAQVRETPENVAVVYGAQFLSYRELDRRANQLARRLRSLGVAPEAPVGVCMERSFELVIAVLGILKAGGVYVPLDPANPRERRAVKAAGLHGPCEICFVRRFAGVAQWQD